MHNNMQTEIQKALHENNDNVIQFKYKILDEVEEILAGKIFNKVQEHNKDEKEDDEVKELQKIMVS